MGPPQDEKIPEDCGKLALTPEAGSSYDFALGTAVARKKTHFANTSKHRCPGTANIYIVNELCTVLLIVRFGFPRDADVTSLHREPS